jgi:hypothetical protein
MKAIQKPTTNLASLRSMVTGIKAGTYAAYQIEQAADARQVGREVEAFIGKDLKPVTVVLIKGP